MKPARHFQRYNQSQPENCCRECFCSQAAKVPVTLIDYVLMDARARIPQLAGAITRGALHFRGFLRIS